jgi:RNA recognition motif-containing protein
MTYSVFLKNLTHNASALQILQIINKKRNRDKDSEPHIHIPIDHSTKRNKGFAFIKVHDIDCARRIIVRLNGYVLDGQMLSASLAYDRSLPAPQTKDKLFDTIDSESRDKLLLDEVAEYSVTPISLANLMSKMIINVLDKSNSDIKEMQYPLKIVDGTACVVGNTISFAKYFAQVAAVEIDQDRFAMLKNNVQDVLSLKNVDLIHGDISKMISTERFSSFDCMFIDPPWGGPDYKKHSKLQLHLGELSIPEFCALIFRSSKSIKLICSKLPNNYDFESLTERFSKSESEKYNIAWSAFVNLSLVFIDRGTSAEEFIHSIERFYIRPEDSVHTQVYQNGSWKPVLPKSLLPYL